MPYILKIPARINILGNPSDANEGDFATISAAVDLFAFAAIEESENIILEQVDRSASGEEIIQRRVELLPEPPRLRCRKTHLVDARADVFRNLAAHRFPEQHFVVRPFDLPIVAEAERERDQSMIEKRKACLYRRSHRISIFLPQVEGKRRYLYGLEEPSGKPRFIGNVFAILG